MHRKMIVFVSLFLAFSSFASVATSEVSSLSPQNIIDKIQTNQTKIKDMYAETTTKITSNLQLTTDNKSTTQTIVQKGKMWTKGTDKSKIEMISPMRQVTITNGDQMAIINPETGQKMVQDLSKLKNLKTQELKNSGSMSLEKAKEFFDLSAVKKGEDYVIVGIPKKENKFLGKMEFYVSKLSSEASSEGGWVPVKIVMYDAKGKPMSQSEIEYKEISGAWLPIKNISNVTTPMGAMRVEMEFGNIKVNRGISDKEFAVE